MVRRASPVRSPARASALIAGALLLTAPGCQVLQQVFSPPQVSFDKAKFKAPSFEQLAVDILLRVHNPNPLGAKVSGYSMLFNVDGLTLLDGEVDEQLDLSAGATTTMTLPVTVKWSELADKVSAPNPPDELPFRAAGDLKFDTPLGQIAVPYNVEGKLPVVKPPLVVPSGVKVTSTTLTNIGLALEFEVTNPNGRQIGLVDLAHSFKLQGKEITSGKLEDRLPVPANSSAKRTVSVNISTLQAGAALVSLLTGGAGQQVQVGLTGSCKVQTGYGKLPLNFDSAKGLRLTN